MRCGMRNLPFPRSLSPCSPPPHLAIDTLPSIARHRQGRFRQRCRWRVSECLHAFGEAHGLADVAHPIVRGGDFVADDFAG